MSRCVLNCSSLMQTKNTKSCMMSGEKDLRNKNKNSTRLRQEENANEMAEVDFRLQCNHCRNCSTEGRRSTFVCNATIVGTVRQHAIVTRTIILCNNNEFSLLQ